MLALGWLAYFAFGIASGSLAPLVSPVMRDLHLTSAQMGLVLGVWQLVYIFTALPWVPPSTGWGCAAPWPWRWW